MIPLVGPSSSSSSSSSNLCSLCVLRNGWAFVEVEFGRDLEMHAKGGGDDLTELAAAVFEACRCSSILTASDHFDIKPSNLLVVSRPSDVGYQSVFRSRNEGAKSAKTCNLELSHKVVLVDLESSNTGRCPPDPAIQGFATPLYETPDMFFGSNLLFHGGDTYQFALTLLGMIGDGLDELQKVSAPENFQKNLLEYWRNTRSMFHMHEALTQADEDGILASAAYRYFVLTYTHDNTTFDDIQKYLKVDSIRTFFNEEDTRQLKEDAKEFSFWIGNSMEKERAFFDSEEKLDLFKLCFHCCSIIRPTFCELQQYEAISLED